MGVPSNNGQARSSNRETGSVLNKGKVSLVMQVKVVGWCSEQGEKGVGQYKARGQWAGPAVIKAKAWKGWNYHHCGVNWQTEPVE